MVIDSALVRTLCSTLASELCPCALSYLYLASAGSFGPVPHVVWYSALAQRA